MDPAFPEMGAQGLTPVFQGSESRSDALTFSGGGLVHLCSPKPHASAKSSPQSYRTQS